MLIRLTTLVLLVTLVVSDDTTRPDLRNCPYPLPRNTKMSDLTHNCYIVTNESYDDHTIALSNANDVPCRQNFVANRSGDCVKVVLRPATNRSKKPRPQGVPNW